MSLYQFAEPSLEMKQRSGYTCRVLRTCKSERDRLTVKFVDGATQRMAEGNRYICSVVGRRYDLCRKDRLPRERLYLLPILFSTTARASPHVADRNTTHIQ